LSLRYPFCTSIKLFAFKHRKIPYGRPANFIHLPHSLRAVINEALRIHSTSGVGLHRLVPPTVENPAIAAPGGGVVIRGHVFPPGTRLSVPTYTMHHSKAIWGPDADEFKPSRWAEGTITAEQKGAFIPFSYGPRACLGRSIAEMWMTQLTY
jgi:benzoate 4-monooxygenase